MSFRGVWRGLRGCSWRGGLVLLVLLVVMVSLVLATSLPEETGWAVALGIAPGVVAVLGALRLANRRVVRELAAPLNDHLRRLNALAALVDAPERQASRAPWGVLPRRLLGAPALQAALRPADVGPWVDLALRAPPGDEQQRLCDEAALRGVHVEAPSVREGFGDGPQAQVYRAVAAAAADPERAVEALAALRRHGDALPRVSRCVREHRLARAIGDAELALTVRERALAPTPDDDPPAALVESWRELIAAAAPAAPRVDSPGPGQDPRVGWRYTRNVPPSPPDGWPGRDAPWEAQLAALTRLRDAADAEELTAEEGMRADTLDAYVRALWACRPSGGEETAAARRRDLLEVIAGATSEGVRELGLIVLAELVRDARRREGAADAGFDAAFVRGHLSLALSLSDGRTRAGWLLHTLDAYAPAPGDDAVVTAAAELLADERDPEAWAHLAWAGDVMLLRLDPRHPLSPWLLTVPVAAYWLNAAPDSPWPPDGEPVTRDEGLRRLRTVLDAVAARPRPVLVRGGGLLTPLGSGARVELLDQAVRVLLADLEDRGAAEVVRRYREASVDALQAWARLEAG